MPRLCPRPLLGGGLLLLAGGEVRAEEPTEVIVEDVAPAVPGATVLPVEGRAGSADLGDVLATTTGATVRRLGGLGAFAGVSLRGSDLRQVEVRLDGVPLNPDGVDSVDLSELPLAGLAEVRVFRGRVPASYGATPIGGLVDLRSGERPTPLRLALSVASFGTLRSSLAGGAAGRLGGVPADVLASAELLRTEGRFPYLDDGGTRYDAGDDTTRPRANADRTQGAGLLRWRLGDGRLRWTFLDASVHRDEGLPGPIGAPAAHARLATTRNLAVSAWEGGRGAVHASGRAWHLLRLETLDDRDAEAGLGSTWQRDAFHTLGAAADVAAALSAQLALGASVQGRFERFARTHLDVGADDPARSRGVLGAAVDLRWTPLRGRLALVPGVDVKALLPAGGPAVVAVNPGLVVEGRPGSDVVLRATGGSTFRPPDLTELYGNRGALVGNDALRPERAWTGDLGIRWATPRGAPWHVDVEASGFARLVRDRITWVQNAQRTLVPVNFGRALVAGAELGLGLDLAGWAGGHAALTWTEGRNLADDPAVAGRRLPFVPRVQVDTSLHAGWRQRVVVGWTFHLTDGVFSDAANLQRQATRAFHGLSLRTTPFRAGPTLELEVRNVADRRTDVVPRDPLAGDATPVQVPVTDFVGYPLPGRTFWATLSWTPEIR
jgi:outer membrane receptor protein involved in Fe transport